MHLLQFVDTLDAGLPGAGLEAESLLGRCTGRSSEICFNNWGKLQEIAAQDELYAAKGSIIATNVPGNSFDFLQKDRLLNSL